MASLSSERDVCLTCSKAAGSAGLVGEVSPNLISNLPGGRSLIWPCSFPGVSPIHWPGPWWCLGFGLLSPLWKQETLSRLSIVVTIKSCLEVVIQRDCCLLTPCVSQMEELCWERRGKSGVRIKARKEDVSLRKLMQASVTLQSLRWLGKPSIKAQLFL